MRVLIFQPGSLGQPDQRPCIAPTQSRLTGFPSGADQNVSRSVPLVLRCRLLPAQPTLAAAAGAAPLWVSDTVFAFPAGACAAPGAAVATAAAGSIRPRTGAKPAEPIT